MIKNVIFDLGKVLIDYDFDKFFVKIGNKPDTRTLDEANREILLFEAGKTDKQKFYEDMKRIYGFSLSFEKFKLLWCDVFWEIPRMIQLAKKIKESGYNIYIFSNTDQLHFPYIWQKFPSINFFENNLMLSYELGFVKPEEEIYHAAIKKFGINPEKSIFIDDRSENIKTALEIGFNAIHHTNYGNTYNEIKKRINLEDK